VNAEKDMALSLHGWIAGQDLFCQQSSVTSGIKVKLGFRGAENPF
jgi:hypothetical protein